MQASLFLYNMKDVEPKIRTKLHEKLFDRTKKSNYSSYAYEIKGILTKGEYIRPVRAVLIIKKEYAHRIADLFDTNGIRYRLFEINISSRDFKKSSFF
jgi:hypothetical protein